MSNDKPEFRQLHNSEEQFRQMVEDAGDAILAINYKNGVCLYMNKKAEELMSMKRESVLGKSMWELQPVEQKAESQQFLKEVYEKGEVHDMITKLKSADGRIYDVELSAKVLQLGDDKLVQMICRDITGKRELERENKYMREYFEQVLNIMPIGLGVKRGIGGSNPEVEFENSKMKEMYHETSDHSLHDAWHDNVDLDCPCHMKINDNGNYSEEHKLSDGKTFQLTINYFRDYKNEWRELQIVQDITRQKQLEEELKQINEQLEHKVENRTRELQSKQTQLIQAEKMAALGNLVAGVAHEINTPMGALKSNNDLFIRLIKKLHTTLDKEYPDLNVTDNDKVKGIIENVDKLNDINKNAAERIVNIITSLRNFARLDQPEKDIVDIHVGLESTLTLVHHEYKRRIEVIKEYGDLPKISCYPNQLNQVFMNILMNAAQAIDGTGTVTITTSVAGKYASIAITDSGSGIKPEHLKQVFDPGFTTKSQGIGTGLGLSIVHQIIQAHGGQIKVDSVPGKSTRFTILIPLNPDNPAT